MSDQEIEKTVFTDGSEFEKIDYTRKLVISVKWSNGAYKNYEKFFSNEAHYDNWERFIEKRHAKVIGVHYYEYPITLEEKCFSVIDIKNKLFVMFEPNIIDFGDKEIAQEFINKTYPGRESEFKVCPTKVTRTTA